MLAARHGIVADSSGPRASRTFRCLTLPGRRDFSGKSLTHPREVVVEFVRDFVDSLGAIDTTAGAFGRLTASRFRFDVPTSRVIRWACGDLRAEPRPRQAQQACFFSSRFRSRRDDCRPCRTERGCSCSWRRSQPFGSHGRPRRNPRSPRLPTDEFQEP